jgi:hypothetical protein
MSIRDTKPEHEVAYQDLVSLMRKHADQMTSLEMLAIGANMLGKLIAMQDQRTVTSDMAMEIVIRNIEVGNQQVLEALGKTQGVA